MWCQSQHHQLLKSNTAKYSQIFCCWLPGEIYRNCCCNFYNVPQLSVCSGALNNSPWLTQKPRYCGMETNHSVRIYCLSSKEHLASSVQWYKVKKYNDKLENAEEIKAEGRIEFRSWDLSKNALLHISGLTVKDKGVYFCKSNNTWGSGTQLQVDSKMLGQQMQTYTHMIIVWVAIYCNLLRWSLPLLETHG